jgi:hypothetical protein
MYITTPSVNPVDESTLSVFLECRFVYWVHWRDSDIHNRLLARNTANVDSSTGFTGGVVIYITDY